MSHKTILVAEDEKAMATALDLKLRSVGFETQVVRDGEAVISAIERFKCDLLILDLMMPKKDGFAVLDELKKKNICIPVLVASNLGQDEDRERALSLGAKGYFVKSDTTLATIIEQVKKALGE